MAEKKTIDLDWNTLSVDETVTAEDLAASEDLSNQSPVGKFLVTVVKSIARENAMTAYTCVAANLEIRIDDVLEVEKPVIGDDGKPVQRNGETVMKRMPVEGDEKVKANLQFAGQKINEAVNMAHPKEKDAMKRRRLFIAKKLGLITGSALNIPTRAWGVDIIGKQAVVTTEWNRWTDKTTGETRKNVRVAWDGWDYAETANLKEVDFSGI
jgi:hypothetical protein